MPLAYFVVHAWFSAGGVRSEDNNPGYNSDDKEGDRDDGDAAASRGKPGQVLLRRIYRVATVVAAFAAAIGLSEGTTVMVKLWVQRKRPNYYALCGFDAATKSCTNDLEHVREVSHQRQNERTNERIRK